MNITTFSEQLGNTLILLFLVGIPFYGYCRKVPVYDKFIEGAKEGIPTFIRLVPYMVAMLVAVGMLRAAGGFDLLAQLLTPVLTKFGIPPEIIPIAILRPFSASAALAAVADLLHTQGGNSFVGHMGIIVASTTESTFYIIAIYFGAASIRNYRHVVPASVIVDMVGIISAIAITKWLLQ
jgi:spore maturation protein B